MHLLDEAVRVPGTRIRVGLDALLGLLPVGGDAAGALLSGWVIVEAARAGAPRAVVARMLGNVLVDAVVGAVPGLGDLFDVGWKANRRNLDLLEAHLAEPARARRGSAAVLAGAAAGVLLVVAAVAVLGVLAARAILGLLSGG